MTARDLVRNTIWGLRNLARGLRRRGLECVVLPIEGGYPERTVRREPLPFPFNRLPLISTETSLEGNRSALRRIGADRRVRCVVLRFGDLKAGPAALHSLRRMLLDLREQGKRLIAWLPGGSTWTTYLASACDEIVLPRAAQLLPLGLRAEPLFLKETLALVGVEADLEAIAEYKTSPDTFRRTTMSEPHREMLNGILDSYFEEIVSAIAQGRGLTHAQVRHLIDRPPLGAAEAVEAGLADAVLYEDELADYLDLGGPEGEGRARRQPSLCSWRDAARRLRQPLRWSTRQAIGVVSLEGMIVPGRSRRLPVPIPVPLPVVGTQAGAETVIQALRQAESDRRIVAVVFLVDSPGGSEAASDLIWREVRRLRERKPVVVLMGEQAASGGYYVAAPANRIVARPATLTGSIGVWGGKFVLAGLFERLAANREAVQRGALAGLYSEMAPFGDEERARVRQNMGEAYARFKSLVAAGRGKTEEQVEKIARGRVWTGVQAHEIGLVDELGDFETALALAKDLAGLKPEREYTVVPVRAGRQTVLPPPFPSGEAAWWGVVEALQSLARERVWALAPWSIQIRD